MKKLFALLLLVLVASPLFAANTITITASDSGSGVLSVYYNVDAASTSDPVGIALNFSSSAGTTQVADVTNVDPCFPVYLDYAHDNNTGYDFDPVVGTPLAKPDAAGVPAGTVSNFAVCMGRLEKAAPSKGVAHKLCDIKFTAVGAAAYTDVTIAADTLRGGVVGSVFTVNVPATPVRVTFAVYYNLTASAGPNGTVAPTSGSYLSGTVVTLTAAPAAGYAVDTWTGATPINATQAQVTMTSNKTVSVTFKTTDCLYAGLTFDLATGITPSEGTFTVTQAMVDKWTALGKPSCWCCKAQKLGNGKYLTTSASRVDTQDLSDVKLSWFLSSTQVGYLPCSDYNLSGRVDTADLSMLKRHWFQSVGACQ